MGRCTRERERLKETDKKWSNWWEWRNKKWRDRANTDGGLPQEFLMNCVWLELHS